MIKLAYMRLFIANNVKIIKIDDFLRFAFKNQAEMCLKPADQYYQIIVILKQFANQSFLMEKHDRNSFIPQQEKGIPSFVRNTYNLINNPQNASSICWGPDGVGFILLNTDHFTKEILPSYFKHNKFESFVRQLNMYNFRKIKEVDNQHYFFNAHFIRGDVESLRKIKRKPERKKREFTSGSDQLQNQNDSEFHKNSLIKSQAKKKKRIKFSEKSQTHSEDPILLFSTKEYTKSNLAILHPQVSFNQSLMKIEDQVCEIEFQIGRIPLVQTRNLLNTSIQNFGEFQLRNGISEQSLLFCD